MHTTDWQSLWALVIYWLSKGFLPEGPRLLFYSGYMSVLCNTVHKFELVDKDICVTLKA